LNNCGVESICRFDRVEIPVTPQRKEKYVEVTEQDNYEAALVTERIREKTLDFRDDRAADHHRD
jgi:hypothetical protein